jgi:peptidoglycan hydrolase-like protein with peptidoglycan-binding domain
MIRAIVCLCVALVATTSVVQADETTRRVQEELRKRNLYFGDIDGESTPELIGALKRYQQRKGFKATGAVDRDTAVSLHVQSTVALTETSSPAEVDLPIVPEPPAEAPAPSQDISPERINKFVEAYLRDAETNDIYLQAWFYAFPVQYFGYGLVDLDFVTKDISYHVKDWPERKYKLAGPATLIASGNEGETLLEFSIDFERRNKKRTTSGKAKYFWTVQSKGDDLRIVSIREQLLPNK